MLVKIKDLKQDVVVKSIRNNAVLGEKKNGEFTSYNKCCTIDSSVYTVDMNRYIYLMNDMR